MGINIEIQCEHCGWNNEFRLGTGAAMSQLQNALDLVPETQRIRILEILQRYPEHAEDFELCLFRCPGCDRFFEQMQVSLLYGDGKHWESRYHCEGCGSRLEHVADMEEIPTLPCPDCNTPALSLADTTFWE